MRSLLALALCLPLLATAQIKVQDDRGAAYTFARSPQRIVTLLPSLTESVCALGACGRLVGTDRFSNAPVQVLSLPKLGGLEDAQIERIASLKPDLVLAAPSARAIERLESLGLRVMVFDTKTHADVKRTLQVLGVLLVAPGEADAVWSRIEADITEAAQRIPVSLRGRRVYFEVDATPYAAGASSFIGETLTRLGLGNVIAPELGPFPRLTPEFVVQARPDLIVATKNNLSDMPKRPGWSTLEALRLHRSCGFELGRYELLVRPGPRMGEAALMLADCLARLPGSP